MKKLTPYRVIAKNVLRNWQGLTPGQADDIVKTVKFDELEKKAWGVQTINAVIKTLADKFNLSAEQTKELSLKIFDQENVYRNDQIKNLFNLDAGANNSIIDEVYEILKVVHNNWVTKNASKFLDPGRENKKFQHLPTELIGFAELSKDLIFVEPIISAFGRSVDVAELKSYYNLQVEKFFKSHNITSEQVLCDLILSGKNFYNCLSESNYAKTNQDAQTMVANVIENNPEIVRIMKLVELNY